MTRYSSIGDAYRAAIDSGAFDHDPAQAALVQRLDALQTAIVDKRLASKGSALGWIFAKKQAAAPIRGLYVYGDVGRGKTALMDMFYETTDIKRKRRAHFHAFMAEVHERIHAWRQKLKKGEVKGDDPIAPVASLIASEARLLCFDEFQVEDIADAMILGRLFARLFEAGTIVIATSNTEPQRLYWEGLSRDLFLPSIELIIKHMDVVSLDAKTDYRQEKLIHNPRYLTPLSAEVAEQMDAIWTDLVGEGHAEAMELPVKGRAIHIPHAHAGVARFGFADICEAPLAASDYLVIAHHFNTIMIDDVPVMPVKMQNEARRFVNLIDALYDTGTKLIVSAEAAPEQLHLEGRAAAAFHRTASRLKEMQSEAYISAPKKADAAGSVK